MAAKTGAISSRGKDIMTPEEKRQKNTERARRRREKRNSDPALREEDRKKRRESEQRVRDDPAKVEQRRLYGIEWRKEHAAHLKAYREEMREELNAKARECMRSKRLDPEFKRLAVEAQAKYLEKPEKKEMRRAAAKRRYRRKKSDPAETLLRQARSRLIQIRRACDGISIPKASESRFEDYFGCDSTTLVAHIASQFGAEMIWGNYGKIWSVDHIIPISAWNGDKTLLVRLNHYKNLRPMLAAENIRKGDKMPDFFPEGVPFTMEEVGWSPPPLKERGPTEVRVQDAGDSAGGTVGVATGV